VHWPALKAALTPPDGPAGLRCVTECPRKCDRRQTLGVRCRCFRPARLVSLVCDKDHSGDIPMIFTEQQDASWTDWEGATVTVTVMVIRAG
jgi:hypothetical protein